MTLLLFAIPAFAQDRQEVRELRRYTVEMIIFQYAQDVSVGTEVFVPDAPPERPPTELELALEASDTIPSERFPDDGPDVAAEIEREKIDEFFSLLPEEDFTLAETFARMERLEVYEPLMHFGWSQLTVPEEDAEVRALSSFTVPPAGLEGDLTLYLSRFLHLSLNLQLDAKRTPGDPRRRERRVDILGNEVIERVPEQMTRYRIVENRIVRNGELRYFDHPKFGVLAKVTRVEESDEETDAPDIDDIDDAESDELLGDIAE